MTTPQTSFLSEIESNQAIPLGKLAYLRERTRNRLYDFIVSRFIERSKDGFTKADLARRIGKKPEVVTRLLGAPGNWTIDTLSDLLAGIGAEELEPQSISLLGRAPRNHSAPEWLHTVNITSDKPVVRLSGSNRTNAVGGTFTSVITTVMP